jgi:midasin (ATPase involved in ribosome maturation)
VNYNVTHFIPGFQVFASVHQESESSLLNLSPATRSRFTEIHVVPYNKTDLKSIIHGELMARLPESEVSYFEGINCVFANVDLTGIGTFSYCPSTTNIVTS